MKNKINIINIKEIDNKKIDIIVNMLEKGKIIIFPTDTVYGLGCNGLIEESVNKMYKLKERSIDKPFLVHVGEKRQIYSYIKKDNIIESFIKKTDFKYLSILFEAENKYKNNVFCKDNFIGFRVIDFLTINKILSKCKFPVLGTSANISGNKNIQTIEKCIEKFSNKVDLYIDAGINKNNIPSTIIKYKSNNNIELIREGKIKYKI